ncbi:Hypothetical predicted protein [Cloeon dipterum]|uniref:Cytochrome P450 n=1 Tax=Cloeon dipterum TaxID=197152 RepID=A0A8S1E368_9INSE|nr:Hypothetical predicted protein [Cloeon dipterum]
MLHFVLLVAAVFLFIFWASRKPGNFPPGPPRWPVIGNYLEIFVLSSDRGKQEVFATLSRIYGGIMGLHLGSQPTIVVSDFKMARELSSMGELCGRPRRRIHNKDVKKFGLIFNDGDDWREQRRFTLRHMRELGFGKMSLEGVIHAEVEDLLRQVATKAGADFSHGVELSDILGVASVNVLWFVIARERYSHDDPRVNLLAGLIRKLANSLDAAGTAHNTFPWLMSLLPGSASKLRDAIDVTKRLEKFLQERIHDHILTLDKENPRDFIDIYLIKLREQSDEDKIHDSFSSVQLVAVIGDMFMAGLDTTFNSMAFALLYMVCYPEVQQRVYEEIINTVGRSRLPSLEDRRSLPYVEATIEEIFRMSSVLPLAVPHAVLHAEKDVNFQGYNIPKASRILINLAHIHGDEKLWGDPRNFRPERFLTEDNKVKRPEFLMPFGVGKRQCPGETLARSNMFLFFTSIIQRFELSVPKGSSPPDSQDFHGALTLSPKPYKAKFTPRISF